MLAGLRPKMGSCCEQPFQKCHCHKHNVSDNIWHDTGRMRKNWPKILEGEKKLSPLWQLEIVEFLL